LQSTDERKSDVTGLCPRDVARVYADPYFWLSTLMPITQPDCPLSIDGSVDSILGSGECDKEGVADHLDHDPRRRAGRRGGPRGRSTALYTAGALVYARPAPDPMPAVFGYPNSSMRS
jgi:hypothetical protein